jgi:hypothetical protein
VTRHPHNPYVRAALQLLATFWAAALALAALGLLIVNVVT